MANKFVKLRFSNRGGLFFVITFHEHNCELEDCFEDLVQFGLYTNHRLTGAVKSLLHARSFLVADEGDWEGEIEISLSLCSK